MSGSDVLPAGLVGLEAWSGALADRLSAELQEVLALTAQLESLAAELAQLAVAWEAQTSAAAQRVARARAADATTRAWGPLPFASEPTGDDDPELTAAAGRLESQCAALGTTARRLAARANGLVPPAATSAAVVPWEPPALVGWIERLLTLVSQPQALRAMAELVDAELPGLAVALPTMGRVLDSRLLQPLSMVASATVGDIVGVGPALARAGVAGAAAARVPIVGGAVMGYRWWSAAEDGERVGPMVVTDVVSTAAASFAAGAVSAELGVATAAAVGFGVAAAPVVVGVTAAVVVAGVTAWGVGTVVSGAMNATGASEFVATAVESGVAAVTASGRRVGAAMGSATRTATRRVGEAAHAAADGLRSAWDRVFG